MNISEAGMNIAATQQSNTAYTQQNKVESNITTSTQALQSEINKAGEEQQLKEQKNKLNELAQQLNKELNPLNTSVVFSFSEDIEGLYITVSERDTNRVIRKIPSDEAMQLMAKMKEVVGMIFSKQA